MSDESFNNFTPRAQQVLALAHKEATRMNHAYVSPEHIILGLLMLGQGVAVNVLQSFNLDLETIRSQVEGAVPAELSSKGIKNPFYTPSAKNVLNSARKEAKHLTHTYVGTEHLLLGILLESGAISSKILHAMDVEVGEARVAVLKELDPNFGNENLKEKERKEHEKWAYSIISQYPEVLEMEKAIAEIRTKKERAIKNQDFEGAASTRHEELALREKLEKLTHELFRRLSGTQRPKMDPTLGKFFREVACKSGYPSRQESAQKACDCLLKHISVIIDSAPGSGNEAFIQQVALSLFTTSLQESVVPYAIIYPDHLAFGGDAADQYEANLESITRVLLANPTFILILACYGHDIGMALARGERDKLEKEEEYKNFVLENEGRWLNAQEADRSRPKTRREVPKIIEHP